MAVVLAGFTGIRTAAADTIACGVPITSSVTLDRDLVCHGSDDALVIGAHGVTVDLGGYMVRADEGRNVVIDGFNNVTIRDGRLAIDSVGVSISDATHVGIIDVELRGCCPGDMKIVDSRRVRLEGNYFNDVGIWLLRTDNSVVRDNIMTNHNSGPVSVEGDRNVLEENTIFANNGTAIDLRGSRNAVRDNVMFNNFVAVMIWSGAGNRIEGNRAAIQDFGIVVEAAAERTRVAANHVSGSFNPPGSTPYPGDGIRVLSSSTTLRDNTANDNASWGIWAVPGVKDLGGNTATGNAVGQCHNVACGG